MRLYRRLLPQTSLTVTPLMFRYFWVTPRFSIPNPSCSSLDFLKCFSAVILSRDNQHNAPYEFAPAVPSVATPYHILNHHFKPADISFVHLFRGTATSHYVSQKVPRFSYIMKLRNETEGEVCFTSRLMSYFKIAGVKFAPFSLC